MKNNFEEPKKNNLWLYLSIVFVVGVIIYGVYINSGPDYVFTGDFEGEVLEVQKCGEWRYENFGHIPCIDGNGTIGGIMLEFVNSSLDPYANCLQYGWSFPGFNILNETRNFEILDQVIPVCEQIHVNNITETWLEENTYCSQVDCPMFYAPAPHFLSESYSCIKKYNIPFYKDSVQGECIEWFKEDGGLYIVKK